MSGTREKLKALSGGKAANATERVQAQRAGREWLRKSRWVAMAVLTALKEKNITQAELGRRMNVSPQQVSKIVRGTENLTLETIASLEQALNITLFSISAPNLRYNQKQFSWGEYQPLPSRTTLVKKYLPMNSEVSFMGINANIIQPG